MPDLPEILHHGQPALAAHQNALDQAHLQVHQVRQKIQAQEATKHKLQAAAGETHSALPRLLATKEKNHP